MASMTERTCKNQNCKVRFLARTADVKRGWAKFCSKSCKAVEQEKRTGQYKQMLNDRSDLCFPGLDEESFWG
ncbi:MAG TPA: hypothetical protein VFM18_13520 [Methanosarcina sp.]|nr:hypothetical protein [Methanosarcina sp.]